MRVCLAHGVIVKVREFVCVYQCVCISVCVCVYGARVCVELFCRAAVYVVSSD